MHLSINHRLPHRKRPDSQHSGPFVPGSAGPDWAGDEALMEYSEKTDLRGLGSFGRDCHPGPAGSG
jgi:hypothetical protein